MKFSISICELARVWRPHFLWRPRTFFYYYTLCLGVRMPIQ